MLLLLTLLNQIILTIFNFECNVSFYFSILRIVFYWLIVCTSTTRTSWINVSNVLRIMYVCRWNNAFRKSLVNYHAFLNFFVLVIIFTFSFEKRRVVNTSFFIFSALCRSFISFVVDSIFRFFLFFYFLILNIILLFLLIFFSKRCWLMLLYVAIMIIVNSTLCMFFVFVTIA